jgi:hypothetical protein
LSFLPVGFGSAAGGTPAGAIERSLRFNSADSAYLNRTLTTPTNNKIFTFSTWVKRSGLAANQTLFDAFVPATSFDTLRFNSSDQLDYFDNTAGYLTSTQVFRDVSAWYHIVAAVDTTQATSSNRVKLYVNGTQITAFSASAYPSQNQAIIFNSAVAHGIGRFGYSANAYLNGYLTEVNFIDGQALTPSSFGETDSNTGVWKPKAFSGTYGTNGFFLKFADNSNTTAATLGKDSSGNGNNWTPNNFSVTAGAGNDSMVDSPTSYGTDTGVGGEVRGNYATLNPVWKNLYPGVYANGNLDFSTSTTKYGNAFSTIGLTSGKWYVEVLVSGTIGSALKLGVSNQTTLNYLVGTEDDITPTTGVGYAYYLTNGNKATNGTTSAYGNSVASGDIVGIILDLDNGKIWFSKNGTVQASGDPVAGTNAAFTGITANSVWFFGGTTYATQASFSFNFGQRAFAYTAPSGFKALCTQNLPTPTIGATSTTQANDYFNATLYTGTGATQTITNAGGVQPDLVWVKVRSTTGTHVLTDSVRGANKQLFSNLTNAEASATNKITGFTSTGFTLGADDGSGTGDANFNGSTYIGWQWRASNAAGVTNTAGSITSTVSANTTSGFSIVTYTGVATDNTNYTVGHGLGVKPAMIIIKNRGWAASSAAWFVWHQSISTSGIYLDGTFAAEANDFTYFMNQQPTSSLFTVRSDTTVSTGNRYRTNGRTDGYVAYCFAPVAGYSAFGSYTGNGSADGPFVYTGFRPRYVLIKSSSNVEEWHVHDTARDTYNLAIADLYPNSSSAEVTNSNQLDILSNGFKCRSSNSGTNGSGYTFIYAAFAESPFKYSLAR